MTSFIIITAASFGTSLLTLFSGFGLGTILMPVFAIFFPLPVAIASTAVVHLANNLFKAVLVGRMAQWGVVLRFAVPAAFAAFVGAFLLTRFEAIPPLHVYSLGSTTREVTVLKLCIGTLILVFSVLELIPAFNKLQFPRKYLPLGGMLSGFFGGLSGHQGALRSAFLIKLGLSKEAFVATGVMSAVIVDITRLAVYGLSYFSRNLELLRGHAGLMVLFATVSAFFGAWFGKRLLGKMTISIIQKIVAIGLILLGLALAGGVI